MERDGERDGEAEQVDREVLRRYQLRVKKVGLQ